MLACLDLDTFFVSVERLLDPSLVGKQVVVGGRNGGRGVVTSCSYEVRPLGVRSGMSIIEAERLAPNAIFVPTRHDTYGPYAGRVRAILERTCPRVQTASIDEFFLDFRGCERLFRAPADPDDDSALLRVVRAMRQAIQDEVGLPASAGIGTTRAIAKMGSGRAKPAGVLLVPAGQERAFVDSLPVRKYPGIGPVAEARLAAQGIATLGQLLAAGGPLADMVSAGISRAAPLGADRPAFREHDPVGLADGSISNEHTFDVDVAHRQRAEDELRALVERVAWRARRRGVRAHTVTLKLRYSDFETHTHARTGAATDAEADVLATALDLLRESWAPGRRIRLLGVALSGLTQQLALPFTVHPVSRAVDAVRERFGYDAVRLGAGGR